MALGVLSPEGADPGGFPPSDTLGNATAESLASDTTTEAGKTESVSPDTSTTEAGKTESVSPDTSATVFNAPQFRELPSLRPPGVGDPRSAWGEGFSPRALAFDGFGTLFVVDGATDRIFGRDPKGKWFRFGVGDQSGARFVSLLTLEVRGPDLYALDSVEAVLYRFGLDGRFRARIALGARDLGPIDAVDFVVDKAGELWILDRAGSRLLRFGRNGEFLSDLAEGTTGRDRLSGPTHLALDPSGGVLVLEPGRRRIRRFSRQGESLGGWSYEKSSAPAGAVVDLAVFGDEVVLVDGTGRWVRSFSSAGEFLYEGRLRGEAVSAAAFSGDGVLHLALPESGEIARMERNAWRDDGAPEGR